MKRIKTSIGSGQIDQFFELTIPSLFMMMQNIATDASEEAGIGKHETLDRGLTWIISRIEVDIAKSPKYTDEVLFDTYPGDDMKIVFPRYYRMFDKSDEQIIKACAIWVVLNRETKTPVANPFEKVPPSEHYENEQNMPKKVKIPDTMDLIESRKVRYSEIDLNGHLNNTKYMDYMLDVHDSAFYKENRIRHIAINYTHEVKDNDVVDIYSSGGNPEIIIGKVKEQLIFATEVTYDRR